MTKIYIGSHSREHKHDSKVDGDDGLEEESLEVDGGVAHDVEEDGGEEDSEENTEESSTKDDFNTNTSPSSYISYEHCLGSRNIKIVANIAQTLIKSCFFLVIFIIFVKEALPDEVLSKI